MSSLVKILSRTSFRKANNGLISISLVRNHWNKDFLPGPVPQNHEERVKAAKKYNMTVEDYKNYDESEGWGDYPKLPAIGTETKDPYYPWDFPKAKRNFNEPLHIDADLYGEDRYNPNLKLRYSWGFILYRFFIQFLGLGFVCYYFLDDYKGFAPILVKQYPKEGVKHYTFDIED